MKPKNHFSLIILWFTAGLFLLTACQGETRIRLPESVNTPVLTTATLTPSPSPTVPATPIPTIGLSATPLPSATSTPRSHEIRLGETMLGLALRYNVDLNTLITLNPDVDPNIMKVGEIVLIPAETLTPGNQTPFPTPVSMPVSSLNCLPDAASGVWCFGWVENVTGGLVESVIINVNLADQQASQVFSQTAVVPLNTVLPAEKLPFAVYFPPEMPQPFQFSAQFSSSIPLDAAVNTYSRVVIENLNFTLSGAGIANVSGNFTLPENTSRLWVVAVVLDQSGQIIGLRRWESSPSDTNAFKMQVYAVSGEIADVQVFAEAQP